MIFGLLIHWGTGVTTGVGVAVGLFGTGGLPGLPGLLESFKGSTPISSALSPEVSALRSKTALPPQDIKKVKVINVSRVYFTVGVSCS